MLPCWPESHYGKQTGLKHAEIHLSFFLSAGIKGACYHAWLGGVIFKIRLFIL